MTTGVAWPPIRPEFLAAPDLAPTATALAGPDRRWSLLLLCLAVQILTSVGRVHQLFGAVERLHLTLLSAVAAAGLVLFAPARIRGLYATLRQRTTRCVLFLLLWVTVSVPFAIWPGGALSFLLDWFLKLVILYLLVASGVRDARDVERLAFAYFLGAVIYASVVLVRFRVGGEAARLDNLIYYDANDFAALALTALPLGLYFSVGRQPWWRRGCGLAGSAALGIAFVWAGSRGAFIALVVAGGYVLFRFSAVSVFRRLLATGAVMVVLFATASDTFWERMRSITDPGNDYNVTGDAGRLQVWKRGVGYMLSHPVFGVGGDNFTTAEGRLSPLAKRQSVGLGLKWSAAHNSFVQVGAELGVPGLLAFLIMIGAAFAGLRHAEPRAFAQALTASLIAFSAAAFFLSFAYTDMLYALLALAAGLRRVSPSS